MSATQKRPYDQVFPVARAIVQKLTPHCEAISIAGSLRRGRPTVGDIEIVALPKRYPGGRQLSLLGDAEDVQPQETRLDTFLRDSGVLLQKDGPLHKQFVTKKSRIKVDLFLPASAAHWGAIFFIRTGSLTWNRWVMGTRCPQVGIRFQDGLVYDRASGSQFSTPEESDIFTLLGLPFIPPQHRQDKKWFDYVPQETQHA